MTTIATPSGAPLRDRRALREVVPGSVAAVGVASTTAADAPAVPPPPPTEDPFLTVVKRRPAKDVNPHLWQWQAEAIDAWHENDCRGVIEAVTGAGKTMLGLTALFEALRMGVRTLVLVPTAELQNQWVARIHEVVPDAIVGTLGNGRTDSLSDCDVLVAIINSAARRVLLADHQSGLLIADECHRYAAPSFVEALSERFKYRLGLTATYTRPDNAHEDRLDPYFGGVIHRLWYGRALADGVIAPFDIALVGVPLTRSEQATYDQLSTAISKLGSGLRKRLNLQDAPIGKLMQAAQKLAGQKHSQAPECIMARKYLESVSRRLALLANAEAKLTLLEGLAPVAEQSAGTLVFAETIDGSTRAGEVLSGCGLAVDVVSSEAKPAERRGALQRFAVGHSTVLCAPRILDEGIDVPAADLAVVVSGTRQRRQSIQRLGRVIRRKKDGGRGRFVFVYAIGTSEDPLMGQRIPLGDIIPHATRCETFELGQLQELRRFLLEQPKAAEAPTPHGRAADAQQDPQESEPSAPQLSDDEPVEPERGPKLEHLAAEPARLESVAARDETAPPLVTDEAAPIVLRIAGEDDAEEADAPPERLPHVHISWDGVKNYLRAIGSVALLTADQEVDLAKRIEAGLYARHLWKQGQYSTRRERHDLEFIMLDGENAMDHFTRANLRLVVTIAKTYAPGRRSLEFLDLIQEGNLGLTHAIMKFDYRRGFKFSTYASNWIRQAITRSIGNDDLMIRLPIHVHDTILAHKKCEPQTSCDHDVELITRVTRMQPRSIDVMLEFDRNRGMFADDWGLVERQVSADDHVVPHPEVPLLHDDLCQQVNALIDRVLSPRDATIIRQRFGWTGEQMTLDAIGQRHGVTRERIRQIEKLALQALRDEIHSPADHSSDSPQADAPASSPEAPVVLGPKHIRWPRKPRAKATGNRVRQAPAAAPAGHAPAETDSRTPVDPTVCIDAAKMRADGYSLIAIRRSLKIPAELVQAAVDDGKFFWKPQWSPDRLSQARAAVRDRDGRAAAAATPTAQALADANALDAIYPRWRSGIFKN